MTVDITQEELDLFTKNGISQDDIRQTINNYRSDGLSDIDIRAKFDNKLNSFRGQKSGYTYPNQDVKNINPEEFKRSVDTLYDIPQVPIPQRGTLVNSDGVPMETVADVMSNTAEPSKKTFAQSHPVLTSTPEALKQLGTRAVKSFPEFGVGLNDLVSLVGDKTGIQGLSDFGRSNAQFWQEQSDKIQVADKYRGLKGLQSKETVLPTILGSIADQASNLLFAGGGGAAGAKAAAGLGLKGAAKAGLITAGTSVPNLAQEGQYLDKIEAFKNIYGRNPNKEELRVIQNVAMGEKATNAALETISDKLLFGKLFPQGVTTKGVKDVLKNAGKQAITEAGTEGLQEGVSIGAESLLGINQGNNLERLADSMAIGGITGGAMGGVTSAAAQPYDTQFVENQNPVNPVEALKEVSAQILDNGKAIYDSANQQSGFDALRQISKEGVYTNPSVEEIAPNTYKKQQESKAPVVKKWDIEALPHITSEETQNVKNWDIEALPRVKAVEEQIAPKTVAKQQAKALEKAEKAESNYEQVMEEARKHTIKTGEQTRVTKNDNGMYEYEVVKPEVANVDAKIAELERKMKLVGGEKTQLGQKYKRQIEELRGTEQAVAPVTEEIKPVEPVENIPSKIEEAPKAVETKEVDKTEEWENEYKGSKEQRALYNTKINELSKAYLDKDKEKIDYLRAFTSMISSRRDANYIKEQKDILEQIKNSDIKLYNTPTIKGNIDALKELEKFNANELNAKTEEVDNIENLDIKKGIETWKNGTEHEIEYVTEVPKGWTKIEGAMTAPNGYTWYSNNKPYAGRQRKQILVKDSVEPVEEISVAETDKNATELKANESKEDFKSNLKKYKDSKYNWQMMRENPDEYEKIRENYLKSFEEEVLKPHRTERNAKFSNINFNKINNGTFYKGKTWGELFERRLDPMESESWEIKEIKEPTGSLLSDEEKLVGYRIVGYNGSKKLTQKIPDVYTDYITETFFKEKPAEAQEVAKPKRTSEDVSKERRAYQDEVFEKFKNGTLTEEEKLEFLKKDKEFEDERKSLWTKEHNEQLKKLEETKPTATQEVAKKPKNVSKNTKIKVKKGDNIFANDEFYSDGIYLVKKSKFTLEGKNTETKNLPSEQANMLWKRYVNNPTIELKPTNRTWEGKELKAVEYEYTDKNGDIQKIYLPKQNSDMFKGYDLAVSEYKASRYDDKFDIVLVKDGDEVVGFVSELSGRAKKNIVETPDNFVDTEIQKQEKAEKLKQAKEEKAGRPVIKYSVKVDKYDKANGLYMENDVLHTDGNSAFYNEFVMPDKTGVQRVTPFDDGALKTVNKMLETTANYTTKLEDIGKLAITKYSKRGEKIRVFEADINGQKERVFLNEKYLLDKKNLELYVNNEAPGRNAISIRRNGEQIGLVMPMKISEYESLVDVPKMKVSNTTSAVKPSSKQQSKNTEKGVELYHPEIPDFMVNNGSNTQKAFFMQGKATVYDGRQVATLKDIRTNKDYDAVKDFFDAKDDNIEIRLLEPGYEDQIAYFRRGENCLYVRDDVTPEILVHEYTHFLDYKNNGDNIIYKVEHYLYNTKGKGVDELRKHFFEGIAIENEEIALKRLQGDKNVKFRRPANTFKTLLQKVTRGEIGISRIIRDIRTYKRAREAAKRGKGASGKTPIFHPNNIHKTLEPVTKERGAIKTLNKYDKEMADAITEKEYEVRSLDKVAEEIRNMSEKDLDDVLNSDRSTDTKSLALAQSIKSSIDSGEVPVTKLNKWAVEGTDIGQAMQARKAIAPETVEEAVIKMHTYNTENVKPTVKKLINDSGKIVKEMTNEEIEKQFNEWLAKQDETPAKKQYSQYGDRLALLKAMERYRNTKERQKIREFQRNEERKRKAVERLVNERLKNSDRKVRADLIDNILKLENNDGLTSDNVAKLIMKMFKVKTVSPADVAELKKLSSKIKNASTQRDEDIAKAMMQKYIIDNSIGSSAWDKISAIRYINMLGGTVQRILDFVSTGVYQVVRLGDNFVTMVIDKTASKVLGTEQVTSGFYAPEYYQGFIQGAQEGYFDTVHGINTGRAGETARYDLNKPNTFRYRPLKTKKGLIAKSLQGVENAFSVAEKITNGMIKIPDRAYFQARYNTSLLDQLNSRGVNTKRFQKLKGATLSETLTNIAKPEEVEQAILEARENVFQRECTASHIARGLRNLLNSIKPFQIGDWALPFIHTTSVISEDIIDRIGVGLIKGTQKIIDIRKNGGSSQELRDAYNSIAKSIIGMGIIALGVTKGEDEEKSYTDKEITGEYSNAVNIKNVSINAKNIPFILVPHNLGKMLMSNDEQKIKKAVLKTWEAIAETNPVLSKYNEMSKKNKFGNKDEKDILDEFIADTLGVPLAQLFQNATLRNIRNITDEYDRETYVPDNKWATLGNKFKNATPGLSQTLPKKYNTIGEEVKRNNIDNPLEKAVSAFITGHKRLKPENETYNEFKKIGKGFENTDYKGKGNIAMAKIKRGIKVNGENYKMSPEEYSNFQRDYGRINYYFRKVLSDSSFMNKDAKSFVDDINEIKQSAEEAVKITQLGHIPTKYKSGKYRLHKYTEYMLKNYDVLTQ